MSRRRHRGRAAVFSNSACNIVCCYLSNFYLQLKIAKQREFIVLILLVLHAWRVYMFTLCFAQLLHIMQAWAHPCAFAFCCRLRVLLLTIARQLDADGIHADYAVNARAYAHSVTCQWTTGKACGILMMILGHGDTIIINRLNGNSARKSAKSWVAASAKQCSTARCSAMLNTVSQMFFDLFTQILDSRTLSEPLLKNPSTSASACTESFKN
jgi:hypothetical protein